MMSSIEQKGGLLSRVDLRGQQNELSTDTPEMSIDVIPLDRGGYYRWHSSISNK